MALMARIVGVWERQLAEQRQERDARLACGQRGARAGEPAVTAKKAKDQRCVLRARAGTALTRASKVPYSVWDVCREGWGDGGGASPPLRGGILFLLFLQHCKNAAVGGGGGFLVLRQLGHRWAASGCRWLTGGWQSLALKRRTCRRPQEYGISGAEPTKLSTLLLLESSGKVADATMQLVRRCALILCVSTNATDRHHHELPACVRPLPAS